MPSFRGFGRSQGGGDCPKDEWVVTQSVASG